MKKKLSYNEIKTIDLINKAVKTRQARAYMIIAYDPKNPAVVFGYNPKQAAFYFQKGFVYFYQGKQKSNMLNDAIQQLHTIKKIYSHSYIGRYFRNYKHLHHGRNLKFKIIHLSSPKCEYVVSNLDLKTWWHMAEIRYRKTAEKYHSENGSTIEDVDKCSIALLTTLKQN